MTKRASSEARKSAALATSSGRPKRPSWCAARDARAHLGHRRHLEDRAEERRLDEARADRVDADAAPAVVDRHVAHQQHHAALRGVVGAAALEALEALDARDVDRCCRGRCSSIAGSTCLRDQEGALQVDVEHAVPLAGGRAGAPDRRPRRRPRSPARRCRRGLRAANHRARHGAVLALRRRPRTRGAARAARRAASRPPRVRAGRGPPTAAPSSREAQRASRADARCGARDEGLLPREPCHLVASSRCGGATISEGLGWPGRNRRGWAPPAAIRARSFPGFSDS